MNYKIILNVLIFLFTLSSCNNKEDLELSKQQEAIDIKEIDLARKNKRSEIDSLRDTISSLEEKKSNLFLENKKELAEAEISSILKNSFFDHIIIGTDNLKGISNLFNTKLEFTIKNGRTHKSGIKNSFIEFQNKTEIEFISVDQPSGALAKEYLSLINKDKKALQFAFRVSDIDRLKYNLELLNSNFNSFNNNSIYSMLSSHNINPKMPLFFIQYNSENNNTLTKHKNTSIGISSVWFATKKIKETARTLTKYGFEPTKEIILKNIMGRKILFENNNFQILLIESDRFELVGITITVQSINKIESVLSNNFSNEFKVNEDNKSLILSPNQTQSIWIEFSE